MNPYNVWCKWHPLRTVMLGTFYPISFYRNLKNSKVRSVLERIAYETEEDVNYFEKVLKDYGTTVIRPIIDTDCDITDYINEEGRVENSSNGVPFSPAEPRDSHLVIGKKMVYVEHGHEAVIESLLEYNRKDYVALPKSYDQRGNQINSVDAPSITVVGKDLYVDQYESILNADQELTLLDGHDFRINKLTIGGHSDGCFHTLKPGAILTVHGIQDYNVTFPGWDVCFLENQGWDLIKPLTEMKQQIKGRWWVVGEEHNHEFIRFVDSWLNDWLGYCAESVFDVNVLMLDENHVCVSSYNKDAFAFFKKHKIEPIIVPLRHRYFWDGGLHCITLDLYREGEQEDYFIGRSAPVDDPGYG